MINLHLFLRWATVPYKSYCNNNNNNNKQTFLFKESTDMHVPYCSLIGTPGQTRNQDRGILCAQPEKRVFAVSGSDHKETAGKVPVEIPHC